MYKATWIGYVTTNIVNLRGMLNTRLGKLHKLGLNQLSSCALLATRNAMLYSYIVKNEFALMRAGTQQELIVSVHAWETTTAMDDLVAVGMKLMRRLQSLGVFRNTPVASSEQNELTL